MRIPAAALCALALLAAAPVAAQLSVEVRGGAGAGSYGATGAGFQPVPRPSGAVSLAYAASPRLGGYAGYSFSRFGCEEGFCRGVDPVFTSRGFEGGVRVELPYGFWARGGAVLHALAVSSTRGGVSFSDASDPAFGLGVGAGFGIRLGRAVTFTPGVGYVRYTARAADGSDAVAVLTGDVGLRIALGRGL